MDDRQRDIVEGAGLQESRLNTEFIDWLNKWGTTILMIVLVAALSWAGFRWWERRQLETLDEAFVQLEAARTAGSPDNLLAVARDHPTRGAVYEIATCEAAEIYLESARRGVVPGGSASNDDDLISDEQRAEYLDQAESLFRDALERTRGESSLTLHEMRARNGLAAVALTRGDAEEGRRLLEESAAFAQEHGLEKMSEWIRSRMEELDGLLNQPPLHPTDDLAAAWSAEPPADEAANEDLIQDLIRETGEGGDQSGPAAPLPAPGGEQQPQ